MTSYVSPTRHLVNRMWYSNEITPPTRPAYLMRVAIVAVTLAGCTGRVDDSADTRAEDSVPRDPVADVTNYQAAGWWMRGNDTSGRRGNRFALGYERYPSGVLILVLDTLLDRGRQRPPFETTSAESLTIGGLAASERVTEKCRRLGHEPDQHILGVLPDSTPGVWTRPRLAWFVDTVASRFRGMRPDSLACWLPPHRDR